MSIIYPNKPPLGSSINFSHPLAKGLVGCWLMNEGGGNLVRDTARRNDGTAVAPEWGADKLVFNGSTSIVRCGTGLANLPALTYVSLVYPTTFDATTRYICGRTNGSTFYNAFYFPASSSGYISFVKANSLQAEVSSAVVLNKWQTVAVTWDGSFTATNVKFYINGKFKANTININMTSLLSDTAGKILIGNRDDSLRPFDGGMKFLYCYNRALSPSEIQSLYVSPYQFINRPEIGADEYVAAGGVIPLRCLMGVGV